MCWVSRKLPVSRIATDDIKVIKVLRVSNDGRLFSPCFDKTVWEFGKAMHSDLESARYSCFYCGYIIDVGLHSCNEIYLFGRYWANKCGDNLFEYYDGERKFNAVIPKGAEYYVNDAGEYVSDTLIIKNCIG